MSECLMLFLRHLVQNSRLNGRGLQEKRKSPKSPAFPLCQAFCHIFTGAGWGTLLSGTRPPTFLINGAIYSFLLLYSRVFSLYRVTCMPQFSTPFLLAFPSLSGLENTEMRSKRGGVSWARQLIGAELIGSKHQVLSRALIHF